MSEKGGWARDTCGLCRFAITENDDPKNTARECYANPPRVLVDDKETDAVFSMRPFVDVSDYACRFFAPRCSA